MNRCARLTMPAGQEASSHHGSERLVSGNRCGWRRGVKRVGPAVAGPHSPQPSGRHLLPGDRALEFADVNLLHAKHGFHGPLRFRGLVIASLNVNTGPPFNAVNACPSSSNAMVITDPAGLRWVS